MNSENAPLVITENYRGYATRTMKIEGFTENEISELNSMDYREMRDAILDALSYRNNGIGNMWYCGYGVYSVWIRDNAVFVEIGNSCD